jgi:hypothetical protein
MGQTRVRNMANYLLLLLAAWAAPPLDASVRVEIPPGKTVTTARDIIIAARDDANALAAIDVKGPAYSRYVWVPDWVSPASGFAQVSHVANSTFTRTSNIIQPTALADGRLIRLDLVKYAARDEQIGDIVNLYEKLANFDSWFNVRVKLAGPVAVVVDNVPTVGGDITLRLRDGSWAAGKYVGRSADKVDVEYSGKPFSLPPDQVRFKDRAFIELNTAAAPPTATEVFAAAAYLNPAGAELFKVTGSDVPIMRLDEWVAFTFSTVNGGLYYQLTGIKENLEDTIREFAGNDAAQKVVRISAVMRHAEEEARKSGEKLVAAAGRLDPELAKSKTLIEASNVTGRQRVIAFFFGAGTAPTSGVQLVAVTFDIAEDNTDPNNDPYRNAVAFEQYDGGEAIFAMPNGMLAYVVFNKQDKVIASVPDNVATDHRFRDVRSNVSTARVFAGVSCANCHDNQDQDAKAPNWGWQPVVNDLKDTVSGLTKILDDRGRRSSIEALQILASQYSADTLDLKVMLDQARIPYQFRANQATNLKTTREVVAGLADSYWGYWYDRVTPRSAVLDLGQSLSESDAQLFLLRAIDPEATTDLPTFLREDGVLQRVKDGRHVTPAQWRAIYQNVAERTFFKKTEGAPR